MYIYNRFDIVQFLYSSFILNVTTYIYIYAYISSRIELFMSVYIFDIVNDEGKWKSDIDSRTHSEMKFNQ
mgnify:CR=1 FL=1